VRENTFMKKYDLYDKLTELRLRSSGYKVKYERNVKKKLLKN